MAIQNRRGLKKDFDPAKMLPGEFAVSIDSGTENQIVWMCFAPGVVKRIGTYEDFEKYLDENCKTAYEYAVDGGYTGTEDEFKAKMAQECADAIVASSSGTVIPLSDSAEQKLKGLLLHGKSTQDGTPSPSALVDIISAGKYNEATRKYDVEVIVSGKNIIPNDGVSIVGDAVYVCRYNGGIVARKGITYTFSSNYSATALYVRDYNNYSTIKHLNYNQKSISYTPQEDECLSFSIYNSSGIPEDTVVQLEVGSTATPYEAYKEQTATLSLSEPIRSLPDGTSDIVHVDQATKSAWVERKCSAIPFNGTESWNYVSDRNAFGLSIIGSFSGSVAGCSAKFISNMYTYNTNIWGDTEISDGFIVNMTQLLIRDTRFSTVEEYKENLASLYSAGNPLILQYALATPTTEELSAETASQLLELTSYYPNTVVYNDQGTDMDVEYVADTKNYIDNKFAELQAALLATGANV